MDIFQEKIQKSSKTLFILINFFLFAVILDVFIQIAAIIWIRVSPENIIGFTVNGFSIFYPFANSLDISENELITLIVGVILRQCFIVPVLFIARFIFSDIRRGLTPFSEKQVTRLKNISKFLLTSMFLPFFVEILLTLNMSEPVKRSVHIGLQNFIFVFLFYALSKIFDYGRILQLQSDETL